MFFYMLSKISDKCVPGYVVWNILLRYWNSNVCSNLLFLHKTWGVQFLLLVLTSEYSAIFVDQGKRMWSIYSSRDWQRKTPIQRPSIYNEMKNEIFVFFSLLLYLANQDLRGKDEDLNETDKGESHTKTEHSSDVGDKSRGRHHLKRGVRNKTWHYSIHFICQIFGKIGRVQESVYLDQIFGRIVHQLLSEFRESSFIEIGALVKVVHHKCFLLLRRNQI